MEDSSLRSSDPPERLHNILVGIAIVNLQCQIELLGDRDVLFKGVQLQSQFFLSLGPKKIQSGFANCSDS